MKKIIVLICMYIAAWPLFAQDKGSQYATKDFMLKEGTVSYHENMDLLVFEFKVEGLAGKTLPAKAGKQDGAPVLGYVFPTNLKSEDVGFSKTEGIVALAITSHPDFDDSPMFDENNDGNYSNDGLTFHTHWVVLVEDKRVAGGFAVKEFPHHEKANTPPTSPGMHMFMDSPGHSVVLKGNTGKAIVPLQRMNFKKEFNYDVVTAYMEVNTSDSSRPMLGVYKVYGVLSGNLTLPYKVK